jgi:predicted RNase H-like nuclease (RuvC/YqgF family)
MDTYDEHQEIWTAISRIERLAAHSAKVTCEEKIDAIEAACNEHFQHVAKCASEEIAALRQLVREQAKQIEALEARCDRLERRTGNQDMGVYVGDPVAIRAIEK